MKLNEGSDRSLRIAIPTFLLSASSSLFRQFPNFQLVFIKRFRLSPQSLPLFAQRASRLSTSSREGLRGKSRKGQQAPSPSPLANIVRRRRERANSLLFEEKRREEREREREWLACREYASRIRLRIVVLPPSLHHRLLFA